MQAAIFRAAHQPLTIESVDLDTPRAREIIVRTVATGVCHSDLHYVDGASAAVMGNATAMVLGHEPAGIVEAVGNQVTYVKPGDHVVACLSVFCGTCDQCLSGHANRCRNPDVRRGPDDTPRISQGGNPVNQFAGVGSFAEKMLLHENSVVKVDKELPLDRAALVGCGVLTGVGAVLNTAKVVPGSTVAVFGAGGVGLSAIQGAVIAGARQIIAVDTFDSKLEMAKAMGATHFVNAKNDDPVQAIFGLTGGIGVDYAFEAIGIPAVAEQAYAALAGGGTATVIGVMPTNSTITIDARSVLSEKKLQGSGMGSNRFRIDIPRYIDFYRQGRLKLDEMVSRTGQLEDVNEFFRAMKAGEVARTVIGFN